MRLTSIVEDNAAQSVYDSAKLIEKLPSTK
jgi:hypothetical protein